MIGALMLLALYFDLRALMLGVIAVLLLEGISNLHIPRLVTALRRIGGAHERPSGFAAYAVATGASARFRFESERAWRLVVGAMLLLSYVAFGRELWFLPWFMGFAIFGAGVSGICPVLFSLKWLGFR